MTCRESNRRGGQQATAKQPPATLVKSSNSGEAATARRQVRLQPSRGPQRAAEGGDRREPRWAADDHAGRRIRGGGWRRAGSAAARLEGGRARSDERRQTEKAGMAGDDEPAGRRAAERAAATATMAAGRSQPTLIPCENEKRSRHTIRAKVQSIYKRYGPHRPHDHMGQKYSYLYYCIHIYLTRTSLKDPVHPLF